MAPSRSDGGTVRERLASNPGAPVAAAAVLLAVGAVAATAIAVDGGIDRLKALKPRNPFRREEPAAPALPVAVEPVEDTPIAPPPVGVSPDGGGAPSMHVGPFAQNVFTGRNVPLALRHVHPDGRINAVASPAERARAVAYMEAHPDWPEVVRDGVPGATGIMSFFGGLLPQPPASVSPASPGGEAATPPPPTQNVPPGGGGSVFDRFRDLDLGFLPGTRIPVPRTGEGGVALTDLAIKTTERTIKETTDFLLGVGARLASEIPGQPDEEESLRRARTGAAASGVALLGPFAGLFK